jgi:hypothetical protein
MGREIIRILPEEPASHKGLAVVQISIMESKASFDAGLPGLPWLAAPFVEQTS